MRYSNKTLLISGSNTEEIIQTLRKPNNTTHKIVGIVFLNSWIEKQTGTIPSSVKHIPVVCTQDQIINYVSHKEIDDVIVTVDTWNDINNLHTNLSILQRMGINVNLNISPVVKLFNTKNSFSSIGDYNTILLTRNIFSNKQLFAKRILDFVGALIGLIFLAISFIFVAPIIKLTSKGPVFFVQKRVGKNGRTFNFYKYRTMYADAEEQKKNLLSQNEVNGLMFKMSNDPRITKIGKFLRKTSIDELPQFINVLKGDMSLVGTRPPTIDEYEKYSEKYKCRLSMIPGITGMWQISGRSNILDFDEVVKLDMQYIDNWNIFKDIKILFLTVINVIFSVGAK